MEAIFKLGVQGRIEERNVSVRERKEIERLPTFLTNKGRQKYKRISLSKEIRDEREPKLSIKETIWKEK